jgi:hypothetical protein
VADWPAGRVTHHLQAPKFNPIAYYHCLTLFISH